MTETEAAFAELLEKVGATHARMVGQLAGDETTLLEAHKWILILDAGERRRALNF